MTLCRCGSSIGNLSLSLFRFVAQIFACSRELFSQISTLTLTFLWKRYLPLAP